MQIVYSLDDCGGQAIEGVDLRSSFGLGILKSGDRPLGKYGGLSVDRDRRQAEGRRIISRECERFIR